MLRGQLLLSLLLRESGNELRTAIRMELHVKQRWVVDRIHLEMIEET